MTLARPTEIKSQCRNRAWKALSLTYSTANHIELSQNWKSCLGSLKSLSSCCKGEMVETRVNEQWSAPQEMQQTNESGKNCKRSRVELAASWLLWWVFWSGMVCTGVWFWWGINRRGIDSGSSRMRFHCFRGPNIAFKEKQAWQCINPWII